MKPVKLALVPDCGWTGPSPKFIGLTRNAKLAKRPPVRFEPVQKQPGDLELVRGKFIEVRRD